MTEQLLADVVHTRTEFVARYTAAHPEPNLADAHQAAFPAGVTAVLNLPAQDA